VPADRHGKLCTGVEKRPAQDGGLAYRSRADPASAPRPRDEFIPTLDSASRLAAARRRSTAGSVVFAKNATAPQRIRFLPRVASLRLRTLRFPV